MRIYFARHGESQANILREMSNRGLKHPLTPTGRAQALALARKLEKQSITRIYSSPVLRAIETSITVAHHLNLDFEVTEALREYDTGIMEGRADAAAWQVWQDLFDDWSIHKRYERRIEGGETFYEVRNRFVPFIQGLIERFGQSDERILCLAHGGLYWMMLPLVLVNVDTEFIARHNGFPYTSCVIAELRPGGLACLEWDEHTFIPDP
jgi:2,3-bisphosphoglycerate-dependent phosphoglycerate mutase